MTNEVIFLEFAVCSEVKTMGLSITTNFRHSLIQPKAIHRHVALYGLEACACNCFKRRGGTSRLWVGEGGGFI